MYIKSQDSTEDIFYSKKKIQVKNDNQDAKHRAYDR